MCGRFVQKTPLGEIQVLFDTANAVPNAPPRYNAAPTDNLAVVRFNPQTRQRSLDLLRWGLVPLWAKDPSFGPKCINARSETVASNNIYRDAFERRRCLVPADAFYEWRKVTDGKPVPYAVMPRDGIFAFAGLWERWKNPADGSILRSFTIVTGPANALCRPIHDRMPVILPPEAWPVWLGEEEVPPQELLALLLGCPEELIRVYPVGPSVGNVRNDEPSLLDPVGAELLSAAPTSSA
ncbi:MAG TPA: SOS response-associated peptidase [Stellaceae bacterium]|jgi:putative SOS response-associated peptidase YedK|nr:SOS response-associated peptidase [Stellaceae bacterium]